MISVMINFVTYNFFYRLSCYPGAPFWYGSIRHYLLSHHNSRFWEITYFDQDSWSHIELISNKREFSLETEKCQHNVHCWKVRKDFQSKRSSLQMSHSEILDTPGNLSLTVFAIRKYKCGHLKLP